MNKATTDIKRPRISEMLETQVDFFAPVIQVKQRRIQGRALGRFVTLVMLLILVAMLAAQTVVASPVTSSIDQIGANSLLFPSAFNR